jgi:AcrR family transcriptional regulator
MGRRREHDERTARELLLAAERIVAEDGLDALSVRRVAGDAGTSTRAVYSLFGSKDGLVAALGARAYELLGSAVAALPETEDPAGDLVLAGLQFRRFAIEHPALFAIGVQRAVPDSGLWERFRAAAITAWEVLRVRLERLAARDLLGGRAIDQAAMQFHVLCEGLAVVELRGTLGTLSAERIWREALTALIAGFNAPVVAARPRGAS